MWNNIIENTSRCSTFEWAVSTTFWLAVDAWIVVKFALCIPNRSKKCLNTGTIQFVVQDALLTTFSPKYLS